MWWPSFIGSVGEIFWTSQTKIFQFGSSICQNLGCFQANLKLHAAIWVKFVDGWSFTNDRPDFFRMKIVKTGIFCPIKKSRILENHGLPLYSGPVTGRRVQSLPQRAGHEASNKCKRGSAPRGYVGVGFTRYLFSKCSHPMLLPVRWKKWHRPPYPPFALWLYHSNMQGLQVQEPVPSVCPTTCDFLNSNLHQLSMHTAPRRLSHSLHHDS